MGMGRRNMGIVSRGGRISLTLLMASMTFSGALQAQRSSWAQSRSCKQGGSPHPSLGIGTFHCQGGSCLIGGVWATQGRGQAAAVQKLARQDPWAWDFSTEPRLWEIDPSGPAAGRIRDGDVLVAVNGAPVTTREAGRQLEAMKAGTAIELTLRRGGALVRTSVVPTERCDAYRVSSGPDSLPRFLTRDSRGVVSRRSPVDESLSPIPTGVGTVRFEAAGLVLAGATDLQVARGGQVRWRFVHDPVVAEVLEGSAAGRGGIVPGEVIIQAGVDSLTTTGGVAALAAAGPGHPVVLFVRRGQSFRQVTLYGSDGGRQHRER